MNNLLEDLTESCSTELPHVEHYSKPSHAIEKPAPAKEEVSEFLVQCCAWGLGAIIALLLVGSVYEAFQV